MHQIELLRDISETLSLGRSMQFKYKRMWIPHDSIHGILIKNGWSRAGN